MISSKPESRLPNRTPRDRPSRKLIATWEKGSTQKPPAVVSYQVKPVRSGTRRRSQRGRRPAILAGHPKSCRDIVMEDPPAHGMQNSNRTAAEQANGRSVHWPLFANIAIAVRLGQRAAVFKVFLLWRGTAGGREQGPPMATLPQVQGMPAARNGAEIQHNTFGGDEQRIHR